MSKSVIVTSCDANFFELLKGLVISIRRNQPRDQDVVVLDCGLEDSHRSWLSGMGVGTVALDWDIPVVGMGEWFKSLVARPHLPRWAPGYNYYIWIDTDAWVQDWEAIEILLKSAEESGIAAVPVVDRAYPMTTGVRPENHTILESTLAYNLRQELYGPELAQRLVPWPMTNSGVIAARGDSALWHHWPLRFRSAIEKVQADARSDEADDSESAGEEDGARRPIWRGRSDHALFFAVEVSFNVALYEDIHTFTLLPAWCNWLCNKSYPRISEGGDLLESQYPFRRIGIVHMAAETKEGSFELLTRDGSSRRTASLRCPWVDK